jgi:hypothetical protein
MVGFGWEHSTCLGYYYYFFIKKKKKKNPHLEEPTRGETKVDLMAIKSSILLGLELDSFRDGNLCLRIGFELC